jgi:hypothetical protein
MLGYKGPAQPSPTTGEALNAGSATLKFVACGSANGVLITDKSHASGGNERQCAPKKSKARVNISGSPDGEPA